MTTIFKFRNLFRQKKSAFIGVLQYVHRAYKTIYTSGEKIVLLIIKLNLNCYRHSHAFVW